MPDYTIQLWSPLPGARMPRVTFDADDEMRAAALALRHFKRLGHDLSAHDANVDVETARGEKMTILVDTIFRWLKRPEAEAFVKAEGLESLTK